MHFSTLAKLRSGSQYEEKIPLSFVQTDCMFTMPAVDTILYM